MKVLVLSVLIVLCANGYAATLSKEQAVALANAVASDKGFDLSKFSSPSAHYEPEYKRNEWFICYQALGAGQTTSAFYVILNDGSSTASALLTVGQCK